jgi:hypothetical protein
LSGPIFQYVSEEVRAGTPLVVALDGVPGRLLDVGVVEHLVLGLGELPPFASSFKAHLAQFPTASGIFDTIMETTFLLVITESKSNPSPKSRCVYAGVLGRRVRPQAEMLDPRPFGQAKTGSTSLLILAANGLRLLPSDGVDLPGGEGHQGIGS